jgi:hypothetical protein
MKIQAPGQIFVDDVNCEAFKSSPRKQKRLAGLFLDKTFTFTLQNKKENQEKRRD